MKQNTETANSKMTTMNICKHLNYQFELVGQQSSEENNRNTNIMVQNLPQQSSIATKYTSYIDLTHDQLKFLHKKILTHQFCIERFDLDNNNVFCKLRIAENTKYLHLRLSFNELKGFDPSLESVSGYFDQQLSAIDAQREQKQIDEVTHSVDVTNLGLFQERVDGVFERIEGISLKALGMKDSLIHDTYIKNQKRDSYTSVIKEKNVIASLNEQMNSDEVIILTKLMKPASIIYQEQEWGNTKLQEFFKIKLNIMRRNDPAKIDQTLIEYVTGELWMQKNKPPSIQQGDLDFCLKMPGIYTNQLIDGQNTKEMELINFKLAKGIRIDRDYMNAQNITGLQSIHHMWPLEFGTHLNQIFGRIVYNSLDLLAIIYANALIIDTVLFADRFIKRQPEDLNLEAFKCILFDNSFNIIQFKKLLELSGVYYIDNKVAKETAEKFANPYSPQEYRQEFERKLSCVYVPYLKENQTIDQFFEECFKVLEESESQGSKVIPDILSIQVVYKYIIGKKKFDRHALLRIFDTLVQPTKDELNSFKKKRVVDNTQRFAYSYSHFVVKRLRDCNGQKHYYYQSTYKQAEDYDLKQSSKKCLIRDLGLTETLLKNVQKVNIYGLVYAPQNPDDETAEKIEILRQIFGVFHNQQFFNLLTIINRSNQYDQLSATMTKILEGVKKKKDPSRPQLYTFDREVKIASSNPNVFQEQTIKKQCFKYQFFKMISQIQNSQSAQDIIDCASEFQLKLFHLNQKVHNNLDNYEAGIKNLKALYFTNDIDTESGKDNVLLRRCIQKEKLENQLKCYELKANHYRNFISYFYSMKSLIVNKIKQKDITQPTLDLARKFRQHQNQNYCDETKSIIANMQPKARHLLQEKEDLDLSHLNAQEQNIIKFLEEESDKLLHHIARQNKDLAMKQTDNPKLAENLQQITQQSLKCHGEFIKLFTGLIYQDLIVYEALEYKDILKIIEDPKRGQDEKIQFISKYLSTNPENLSSEERADLESQMTSLKFQMEKLRKQLQKEQEEEKIEQDNKKKEVQKEQEIKNNYGGKNVEVMQQILVAQADNYQEGDSQDDIADPKLLNDDIQQQNQNDKAWPDSDLDGALRQHNIPNTQPNVSQQSFKQKAGKQNKNPKKKRDQKSTQKQAQLELKKYMCPQNENNNNNSAKSKGVGGKRKKMTQSVSEKSSTSGSVKCRKSEASQIQDN